MRADSKLPAGIYRLVTEEEEIPGLSFVAFAPACVVICEGFIGRFPRNKGSPSATANFDANAAPWAKWRSSVAVAASTSLAWCA